MRKDNLKSGFTLLEVIVATACVAALVLLFERFLLANIKAYYQNNLKLQLIDDSISAYNYLNPDIRGATQVLECSPNSLTFYLKIGDSNALAKKISFVVNTTDRALTRSVIEPVGAAPNLSYPEENAVIKIISNNISNNGEKPLFSYFNSSGSQLSEPCTPNTVRMVGIDLRNLGQGNYATGEIQSTTKIELRNLKDNL